MLIPTRRSIYLSIYPDAQSINGKVNAHVGDKKDDDRSRSKPRPKAKAGAKKAGGLKNGPAAKKKTSPRGS